MASATPTGRSLERLKKRGWPAQVVEKWISTPQRMDATGKALGPPGRRIDLFGCIDLVALDGEPGCLGIQACAASGQAARITKAREIPELRRWLAAGNRWECWGWREVWVDTSARTKAKRWQPRIVALEIVGGKIEQRDLDLDPRPPLAPLEVIEEQRENQPAAERDDE